MTETGTEKHGEKYIRPLNNGTAIDHLPLRTGLKIIEILGIQDKPVTAALQVPSKKLGQKDIVFIEGRFLTKEEIDKVSLIAPNATLNSIKNGKVVDKKILSLPEKVTGIIQCINPKCITNMENIPNALFYVLKNPVRVRCFYCEKIMNEQEFRNRLK